MDHQKVKKKTQNKVLRLSKNKVMRLIGGALEIIKRHLEFFSNDLACLARIHRFGYKLSIPRYLKFTTLENSQSIY